MRVGNEDSEEKPVPWRETWNTVFGSVTTWKTVFVSVGSDVRGWEGGDLVILRAS